MEIKIDKEFKDLIEPLTTEERRGLEASIQRDGLRDSLIVWKEKDILLDGHNRLEICNQIGIEPTVSFVSLPDRESALSWILSNQLSRRNVTPGQKSYLRGKRYNLEKMLHGGDRKSRKTKSKGQNEPLKSTAAVLSETYGVSESTIKRDGKFADAVDRVALISEEPVIAKRELLSGKTRLSKKDLSRISRLAKTDREAAIELMADLPSKPEPLKQQTTGNYEMAMSVSFEKAFDRMLEEVKKAKRDGWKETDKEAAWYLGHCIMQIIEGKPL